MSKLKGGIKNRSELNTKGSKAHNLCIVHFRSLQDKNMQLSVVNRLHELSKKADVKNLSASLMGIVCACRQHGGLKSAADENDEDNQGRETKEDVLMMDEDDSTHLVSLTGKPHDDDEIVCAVPILSPYSSLNTMTYKVKLQPGSNKPGKAAKSAIDYFINLSTMKGGGGADGKRGTWRKEGKMMRERICILNHQKIN